MSDNAINMLRQTEFNVLLDDLPNVKKKTKKKKKTRKEIQQLCSGKASGSDAVHAEIYKAGGLPMT